MYNYHEVPLYPPALVILFVAGLVWLLYIILKNEKNRDEKENLIGDVYYIYPLLLMAGSSSGLIYLVCIGKLNSEIFSKLLTEIF